MSIDLAATVQITAICCTASTLNPAATQPQQHKDQLERGDWRVCTASIQHALVSALLAQSKRARSLKRTPSNRAQSLPSNGNAEPKSERCRRSSERKWPSRDSIMYTHLSYIFEHNTTKTTENKRLKRRTKLLHLQRVLSHRNL